MYSKRVVIPTTDNDKDIITYMNRYFILNKLQLALHTLLQLLLLAATLFILFFCWMVSGILFHINGPLHNKLLEDFTVREVKGRICICEACLVS